jgi:hypothetical protein
MLLRPLGHTAACVIAQQYSTVTVYLPFPSHKKTFDAVSKSCYFNFFTFLKLD